MTTTLLSYRAVRSGTAEYHTLRYNINAISYKTKTLLEENVSGIDVKTIDVSSYEGYEDFTIENFAIDMTGIAGYGTNQGAANFYKSYDASTGILTLGACKYVATTYDVESIYAIYNVYLLK